MLYDDKQIPELNYMKHRNDTDTDYVNYQKSILTKTLSSYLFNNNMMNQFLLMTQALLSLMFDQFNIIKNFKNYNVDKYYYKQKN
jgi:hypothetical protein